MSVNIGCVSRARSSGDRSLRRPKPYCQCKSGNPVPWKSLNVCGCGEDYEVGEWKWQTPVNVNNTSWVVVGDDQKTVTFHPFYSSGTASVRGDMAMTHDYHYYWEVKMLSDTYGTDIMVGMCSDKAALDDSQFEFKSLLGQDSESYGLSYKGEVRHQASVTKDSPGFCRGTIVGVRLDMWAGVMEFFINRQSQGITFYNLRRHKALYPVLCSTAAQSSMKLIYAASFRASLQQEAVRILNASLCQDGSRKLAVPPGLWPVLKKQVWLNWHTDDSEEEPPCTNPIETPARAVDVTSARRSVSAAVAAETEARRAGVDPERGVRGAGLGAGGAAAGAGGRRHVAVAADGRAARAPAPRRRGAPPLTVADGGEQPPHRIHANAPQPTAAGCAEHPPATLQHIHHVRPDPSHSVLAHLQHGAGA